MDADLARAGGTTTEAALVRWPPSIRTGGRVPEGWSGEHPGEGAVLCDSSSYCQRTSRSPHTSDPVGAASWPGEAKAPATSYLTPVRPEPARQGWKHYPKVRWPSGITHPASIRGSSGGRAASGLWDASRLARLPAEPPETAVFARWSSIRPAGQVPGGCRRTDSPRSLDRFQASLGDVAPGNKLPKPSGHATTSPLGSPGLFH